MRTLLIIAVLLSLAATLKAQDFAIINDKDGFVNVREHNSASSKIIGKVYASDIFSIKLEERKNDDWIEIYSSSGNKMLKGYVYKSHINTLSSFKHLKSGFNNSQFATIKNDSLFIKVTAENFVAKKHKLTLNGGFYEKIDSKSIWGADGGLPKKAIRSLSVKINNTAILIPTSAVTNLFEPNFDTLTVYFVNKHTIYIRMDNSDGAGAYTVIWTIRDGKYMGRFLDNSEA